MTLAAPAFKGILGDRLAGRNEVWPHAARVSRVVQRPANASRPLSGTISSRLPAGLSQLIEDRDDPGSAQAMSASARPRTKTSVRHPLATRPGTFSLADDAAAVSVVPEHDLVLNAEVVPGGP
jgi:hypothetical protein